MSKERAWPKRIFSKNTIAAVILLLFLISLIPMLAISAYNRPCADDFSYGIQAHKAFKETGSLLEAVKGAAATARNSYLTWQGTFSATFIMGLQPSVFGERAYPASSYILLLLFIGTTAFLLQTLVMRVFGGRWADAVIIGVPMIFLSVNYLPSLVEGFFWFNGSFFYTGFYSLMAALLALYLRIYCHAPGAGAKTRFAAKTAAASILCVIIGGGNYVTALTGAIFSAGAIFLCFVFRKPAKTKSVFTVLFVIILGALMFSAVSPGNAYRQSWLEQPGVLSAVRLSFSRALIDIVEWTDLKVMAMTALMTPVFYGLARKSGRSFKYPLLFFAVSFCVFSAQNAPPYYAMGYYGPERLRNIVYYSYIWLAAANVFYLAGWAGVQLEKRGLDPEKIPAGHAAGVAVILVFLFAGACVSQRRDSSLLICFNDVASGAAVRYAEQSDARLALLLDDGIKDVELAPFSEKPRALFFDDVSSDPEVWLNISMAEYYNKHSIVLLPE